jgi:hypothetical protein
LEQSGGNNYDDALQEDGCNLRSSSMEENVLFDGNENDDVDEEVVG